MMTESISIIPKNALEEIRIDLNKFNGHNLIGIRIFYDAGNDDWRPTKKGITVKIDLIDDVINGLQKARQAARKSGWI